MDMNRWAEAQQHLLSANPNPNPNPSSSSSSSSHHYYNNGQQSSYPHYPFYSQIPSTSTTITTTTSQIHHVIPSSSSTAHLVSNPETSLRPPGIDPPYLQNAQVVGAVEAQAAAAALVGAAYYQDHHHQSGVAHDWVAKEAIRHYGADPTGYAAAAGGIGPPIAMDTLIHANQNPMLLVNQVVQPSIKKSLRRVPKKTKIVQSAWCEVCRIDCNSKDVLDQHKLGKKHKKNLERLEELKTMAANHASAAVQTTNNPVIGPPENPSKTVGTQQSRKKAASSASVEDLETKRRKVMEGGAAAEAVRVCTICNVVCNSEVVFNYHLAGQKHASMVRKQAAGAQAVTAA